MPKSCKDAFVEGFRFCAMVRGIVILKGMEAEASRLRLRFWYRRK